MIRTISNLIWTHAHLIILGRRQWWIESIPSLIRKKKLLRRVANKLTIE